MARRPESTTLAFLVAAGVLLLIGGWLRFITWPWQTHVWAVDYLVYYEPQARALAGGALHHWLFSWEGLHPPVSGAIHGALMAAGAPLAAQWALSTVSMLSAGAVVAWAVARGTGAYLAGLLVFGVACVAPLTVNYGLTVSPYTTAIIFTAASTVAAWAAAEAPTPRRFLLAGVLGGLALQTHVLALAVVGAHGLWFGLRGPAWLRTHRRAAVAWAGAVGVFVLPLVVAAFAKTSDPWTFHQDTAEPFWGTLKLSLHERFGGRATGAAATVVVAVAGLAGLVRRPRGLSALLTLSGGAWIAALLAFFALGVAAPRQSHYFPTAQLLLVGGAAAAWGELPRRRPASFAAALLALVWVVPALGHQLDRRERARAVLADHARARAAVRDVYAGAGEGDTVAYLWAYSFLNDEPEHLDPFAAWPLDGLGGFCADVEVPRALCLSGGGAGFFFDPTSFAGSLDGLDSALMQWIDQARPPGRATLVVVPPSDAGPHPWPIDRWLEGHGGVAEHHPGVSIWRMPTGLRIEEVGGPP